MTPLSGTWIGVSRFAGDHGQCAFRMKINAQDAAFTAEVTEEFGPPSRLRGYCEGRAITFNKRYLTDRPDLPPVVRYEGTLSRDRTRITGRWSVEGPNQWTGNFEMDLILDEAILKNSPIRDLASRI